MTIVERVWNICWTACRVLTVSSVSAESTGSLTPGTGFQSPDAVSAWRATLWEGDQLLSEQKSFLW